MLVCLRRITISTAIQGTQQRQDKLFRLGESLKSNVSEAYHVRLCFVEIGYLLLSRSCLKLVKSTFKTICHGVPVAQWSKVHNVPTPTAAGDFYCLIQDCHATGPDGHLLQPENFSRSVARTINRQVEGDVIGRHGRKKMPSAQCTVVNEPTAMLMANANVSILTGLRCLC